MVTQQLRLLRLPHVLDKTGVSKTVFYKEIREGLFTPPLPLVGTRTSTWPEHEVDAIIAASIAGKNKEETRALVSSLLEQRGAAA
ncbi:MAG: AlpA family phage regulatory protein [Sedimenticola sp.]